MSEQPSAAPPATAAAKSAEAPLPWYAGVSRYEWLVLAIASAGWVFDAFEGQLFSITRNQMLTEVLGAGASQGALRSYGDLLLAVFLVGGTVGGLLFGSLADRWGRRPCMALTILIYSIFSGLTFFAQTPWQVGVLRFLVAMGVGGEWAVAASLVAEVFPTHARAHASGLFHATSVAGTWIAALAGLAVGAHWRYAYLIGVVPALLVLWVRAQVQEPASWLAARQASVEQRARWGSFRELLLHRPWGGRALLGMLLAAVGLGTFWGITVAGQDLVQQFLVRSGVPVSVAAEKAKVAYGFWQAVGGGAGMLAFGPIAARLGRRRTFVLYQACALVIIPATCYLPGSYGQLLVWLPLYGACTVGIHAGFAVFFPELFPHHLRSTGAGFCFNGGRLLAAPVLVLSGWLKSLPGMDLRSAIAGLALLFVPGILLVLALPETKDQPLPDGGLPLSAGPEAKGLE